ncbi:MAG TPA: SRPBCC family protein [Candidatus Saccharimonadia bacterium]|nr:SRPBCC family protein [Candidatus Saccharimonadia bacterium]
MAGKTKVEASEGGREVIVTREFDSPVEKVWRAYTDPELFIQWAGPKGYKGKIDKWDFRPGGSYRFVHIDPQGNEFAFHGTFHGMEAPKKAVQTFEFEGLPEKLHVSMDTLLLEDLGNGKTKATSISVFQTPEDRDGMVRSGMEKGLTEGHERLDELLPKIS